MKNFIILILCFNLLSNAFAQVRPVKEPGGDDSPIPGSNNKNNLGDRPSKNDTLNFEHRDDLKDSISISFKFLDSTKKQTIDSSVNDFDKYFPVPSSWQYLGNNGAAAFPLIFQPFTKAGWDAGFHAYDIYRFTLVESKLYKTSRPFSMIGYQLASGKEQMIKATHTQNPRPNLNAGFDYRLISAPGFFVTQNTNHNAFRIFSNYYGPHKRYNAYMTLVGNTIRGSENGGIINDSLLLDPNKKKRFSVPVNLGGAAAYQPNPFQANVKTGNKYKDFTFLFRQSFDLGKRDSVEINDSTTEYLFYPKLRLQYSFTYNKYAYLYSDVAADSTLYKNWYGVSFTKAKDTFTLSESWKVYTNDFSLLQFPDTKNAAQFFLAGIALQNIHGVLKTDDINFYNIMLHGEYRNRTRNKLWDMLLKGELYVQGFNSGDYSASASLNRYLNKKLGDVNLFFTNVNRSPSFIFDNRSSFNLHNNNDFKKENIISFGATSTNSFLQIGFKNHLLTNYCYFTDYDSSAQYNKPINILQVFAAKKIRLYRHWNVYSDATMQQTDGAGPIRLPLLFTRNRFAFEGKFFRNLNLSTGLELRYYTSYKANNYSPVMGQFVPQDSITISNLPDVNAFLHFRIKGFTGYLRAENLNTMHFSNGFGFVNNNFAAPHYPTPGLIIRFGIQWWFVN